MDADNLAGGLLEFTELTQEVPEARLRNNVIRSENPHAVEGGIGLLLRRQLASDDFVFLELQIEGTDQIL